MFYAVGDIHGYSEVMLGLLARAGLTDRGGAWVGGTARLVFVGDFVDRGPDSPGTVRHVMRLQAEARAAGGRVMAVLGNHDLALVLAARHPRGRAADGETFASFWEWIGGRRVDSDMPMPADAIDWLAALPAMLHLEQTLVMHADSVFYRHYGGDVPSINLAISSMIANGDQEALADLTARMSKHQEFWRSPAEVTPFLAAFDARRLVHGHSPIHKMLRTTARSVRKPLVYADDRCVNLDGGIYMGGPGFVYRVGDPA